MGTLECLTHGLAAGSEHLLSNGGGQRWILSHICGKTSERLTQWPIESSKQGADNGFQVAANAACVGCWSVTHFTHDRVGHEVALTSPSSIQAAAGAPHLPRYPIDRDRSIAAVLQGTEYSGYHVGVDAFITWASKT